MEDHEVSAGGDDGVERCTLDTGQRALDEVAEAMSQGRLFLEYQPIVRLPSGVPLGFEALVRCRTADGQVRYPGEFYPVLTEQLVRDLGGWALAEACRFARTLPEPRLQVSVNVDPRQLTDPAWPTRVLETIAEQGLDPAHVMLELVEIGRLDWDAAIAPLQTVSEAGVGVALDDTGRDFNALDALRNLPVSHVKIDRAFVARIGQRRTDAVVQGLIDIATRLGLTAVAEGVETAEQAEQLERWGIRFAQGFHYSPPLPPEQLLPVLERLRAPETEQLSVRALALQLRDDGMSPPSIANVLNNDGYRTPEGKRWHPATVQRLLNGA